MASKNAAYRDKINSKTRLSPRHVFTSSSHRRKIEHTLMSQKAGRNVGEGGNKVKIFHFHLHILNFIENY